VKCDEQTDSIKALACRRKLLKPSMGACAEGKVDLGATMLGTGAAAQATANLTSKATLIKEMNKVVAGLDKKCILPGADLDDLDTGLGFAPIVTTAAQLADVTNADPGGIGCLANGLVRQTHPLVNEIVDVVMPLDETCIASSVPANLGLACTIDADCGASGICGKLAGVLRDTVDGIKACTGAASSGGGFPATGQTTCWNTAGTAIPCAGTGHDGDIQAGATLAYAVDNLNGTITDTNTGLMWEKLSDDGTIHDKDNVYTWDNAFAVKIATLNGGGGFAGHTDWRVPNIKELQSIVNYEIPFPGPTVAAAFNTGCVATCTVNTCSCTVGDYHWSSSTYAGLPAPRGS
jgi:hypothetical protein